MNKRNIETVLYMFLNHNNDYKKCGNYILCVFLSSCYVVHRSKQLYRYVLYFTLQIMHKR